MGKSQPLSIVIRITNVSIPRATLEDRLGFVLDRYEPSGSASYAQIDVAEEADYWSAALECLRVLDGKTASLTSDGSIGTLSMDIALAFPDTVTSISSVVPSTLVKAAAQIDMDIELSIYRTAPSGCSG